MEDKMAQVMNVPEIMKIKNHLTELQVKELVKEWELPYENLLTRLPAAIFFVTPAGEEQMTAIINTLKNYPNFSCRENTEKKLSQLMYRITFEDPDFK
jgi:ABC-type proline/glycine betaine transport system ATPase subunit